MDAFVQLAMIEKAKRVFAGDPDVMLVFPLLSPLSYTSAELAGIAAPRTPVDYAAAADFARVVNFLPQDIVASASERMLWDVYRDVLTRAEVAHGSAATGTDATILYDVAADGSRVESELLKRYRQYRDAWFVAREDYAAHKLTGELSEDPAVRQNWSQVEEPQLRVAVNSAMRDWEALGQRAAIEAALMAERVTALNSPGVRWAEWYAAFNPDIDILVDAGGGQYAPTGFSPINFIEQNSWLRFELSAAEMKSLVDAAPETLRVVLDDDGGRNIDRLTFEYRSVRLVRPWFQPEALTSRIWRSADPELILSDGLDPPSGVCPAYVSACVFARNIVVTERRTGNATSLTNLHFTIDPKRLTPRPLQVRDDLDILPRAMPRHLRLCGVWGNPARTPIRSPHHAQPRTPPDARTLRAFQRLERNRFLLPQPQCADAEASLRFRRLERNPSPGATRGEPSSPTPTPEAAGHDEISILTFICKRLPKTPDPAPIMHWI